jgi:hypothetical protein
VDNGIAYRFRPKKTPHPLSHMEKEGGACKGLKTIIKEGIAITNLTKNNPTHPLNLRGWVGNNYNK